MEHPSTWVKAHQAFERARRRAKIQSIVAAITGRKNKLIPYDIVRRRVKAYNLCQQYVDEIPIDAIIGSVGRYNDFNEEFLPLSDNAENRWVRLKMVQENEGLPPIDVYKLSDVYFVLDGHHRVSIAKEMGAETIEANVSVLNSKIEIDRKDDLKEVIIKAERAEFLEQTKLDSMYPDLDFSVSIPGKYPVLYEHIRVHQYYLGLELKRDIGFSEAVRSWVENVYSPVIHDIRSVKVLIDFPGRTEADLYLWLKENASSLSPSIGCSGWIYRFFSK